MVTHDHRIIELADRLVHMVDGRIVSDIMLNDALRICEFLKGVEGFKNLTPTELTHVAEHMTSGITCRARSSLREAISDTSCSSSPTARSGSSAPAARSPGSAPASSSANWR